MSPACRIHAGLRAPAIAIHVALLCSMACTRPDPVEKLLAHTWHARRSIAGRVSLSPAYRPFPDPGPPRIDTRLLQEAHADASSRTPSEAAHRLGLLSLVTGDPSRALEELYAAAAGSSDYRIYNDLAVTHLARASSENRAFDLVLALDSIEQAAASAPRSPDVLFNRALVLESLHLRRGAREAYRAFLEVAVDTGWRKEARQRLARLEQTSRAGRFRAEVDRLGDGATPGELRELAREFPFLSRIEAEERVLPAWGAARASGDAATAVRWFRLVEGLADALAEQRGEYLLADAVAAIRSAESTGETGELLRLLARGHKAYGEGIALYQQQQLESARKPLEEARRLLSAAGSPFAGWAAFHLAICTFYEDADRARAEFETLAGLDAERYPALVGRSHWLLGTVLGSQRAYHDALGHYRLALEQLERSSGPGAAAFVHVLFAEVLRPLGEVEAGWRHRVQALETLSGSGDHRRSHSTLLEAAQALLRQERFHLAEVFLDELVANARDWRDHPYALAEAVGQRGWNLAVQGKVEPALAALEQSRAVLDQLEPGPIVEKHRQWLELWQAFAEEEVHPESAVERWTRAFEKLDAKGWRFERPIHLAARARANLRLGRTEAAVEDLEAAVAEYEQTRRDSRELSLRLRYFRQAQPAFEALARLELDLRNRPAAAFEVAERARSRFFVDRRLKGLDAQVAWHDVAAGVRQRLGPDTALVEFALLDEDVVAWVIDREGLRCVRLGSGRRELEAKLRQLRLELEREAPEQVVRKVSAEVFERLVRPLGLSPAHLRRLLLVPEGSLAEVPFTALYDETAGRYLIELCPIYLLPSATLLLGGTESGAGRSKAASALVVGSPELSGADWDSTLKNALDEAQVVASFYADAELLTGEAATRERFLAALGRHEVIHFAGHALANSEAPEESMLLLAPGEDGDGRLRTRDLWSYDLDGVALVVLSACDTMVGHPPGREALFGVAGGFFAAGVDQVVATLWPAYDQPTSEIMKRFHDHYLDQRDAAAALRLAVIDARSRGATSPADWALFTVLGGPSNKGENVWRQESRSY